MADAWPSGRARRFTGHVAARAAGVALLVGYAGAVARLEAARADLDVLASVLLAIPAVAVLTMLAAMVSLRYPGLVPSLMGAVVPYSLVGALLVGDFGIAALWWPSAWIAGTCGLPLLACPGNG